MYWTYSTSTTLRGRSLHGNQACVWARVDKVHLWNEVQCKNWTKKKTTKWTYYNRKKLLFKDRRELTFKLLLNKSDGETVGFMLGQFVYICHRFPPNQIFQPVAKETPAFIKSCWFWWTSWKCQLNVKLSIKAPFFFYF